MVTSRNRRTPSGNCALLPVNTETVRGWKPGIRGGFETVAALTSGGQPRHSFGVWPSRETCYRAVFRRSSGPLLGVSASKPKRGCQSVNKGTREARSSRVIAQPTPRKRSQVSPKRRTSGGVAVVVGGWESQSQGEGRQEVSFWTVEEFLNREGSR